MKIASTLASATEIACALGLGDHLVAISHECDYPSAILGLPRLSRARDSLMAAPDSAAIDREVAALVREGLSLYELDLELLASLQPDVVLAQDLCDVCAIDKARVESAVRALVADPGCQVISLAPRTLEGVWQDVERVGEALGLGLLARSVAGGLRARVAACAERLAGVEPRPRVLAVEWIEPLMVAGLWMPELIRVAGGEPVGPEDGAPGRPVPLDEALSWEPDVILVKPCGYDLGRGLAELSALPEELRRGRRVVVADGNAFFNRSGPRLADSAELLAACLHPDMVPDLLRRHGAHFRVV